MLYREILFFFSALGVFNVLLLAAYLLIRQAKKSPSVFILAALCLCLGIRVGVSCIYFFEQEIASWMIQFGLSAHLLMGVFLVAYLRRTGGKIGQSSRSHMGGALLVLLFGGMMYPFESHFQVWDFYIRFSLHAILCLHLIWGGFLLKESGRKLFRGKKVSLEEKKDLLLYGTICATCLGFAISLFSSYILGPVLFSLIFYSSLLVYYSFIHQSSNISSKYQGKRIEHKKAEELIERLQQKIESEQLFLRPNLKLEELAKSLHISRHQLSQLLNDNLGKSYSRFINEYRIKYAKGLLLQKENLSIEAIAYEVGFNSKSSFYSTFKKLSGETPATFRSIHLLQRSLK